MQNNDDSDPESGDRDGRKEKAQPPGTDAARTGAEVRKARLGKALRDNLARRKQQARARRAGDADETEGLPAAKTDESSS